MKNPPSIIRLFTVMRQRVIAGEPWQAVLADYGLYIAQARGKLKALEKTKAVRRDAR